MSQLDLVALTGARGAEALEEARRTLQICNACRYCEGYCAVFPAMTRRREFPDADLVHIANLCHGCRDCFHACQYAPPHEFAINVPRTMAVVRLESYRASAPAQGLAFKHPALFAAALLIVSTAFTESVRRVFGGDPNGRGFYGVLGREAMIAFGMTIATIAAIGLMVGVLRYLRLTRTAKRDWIAIASWLSAIRNATTLRHLGGGGVGCNDTDETFAQRRRILHHLMAGGFASCFAATSVGAVYDHALGWHAPYPLLSIPCVLGTLGGIGIMAGTAGLLWLKRIEMPEPTLAPMTVLDKVLLIILFLAAASGLALRAADEETLLPLMVVLHMASIAAFFVAIPVGKFLHAPFRVLALAHDAEEVRRANRG